jgi:hypothetical protein
MHGTKNDNEERGDGDFAVWAGDGAAEIGGTVMGETPMPPRRRPPSGNIRWEERLGPRLRSRGTARDFSSFNFP